MIIISDDQYFTHGINLLSGKYPRFTSADNVIFDSGAGYVYLLSASELPEKNSINLFSFFLHIHPSSIMKKSAINEYVRLLSQNPSSTQAYTTRAGLLTCSEIRIIKILCRGLSNRQAASLLNISEKTVSAHKNNALEKLRINNVSTIQITLRELTRLSDRYAKFQCNNRE